MRPLKERGPTVRARDYPLCSRREKMKGAGIGEVS